MPLATRIWKDSWLRCAWEGPKQEGPVGPAVTAPGSELSVLPSEELALSQHILNCDSLAAMATHNSAQLRVSWSSGQSSSELSSNICTSGRCTHPDIPPISFCPGPQFFPDAVHRQQRGGVRQGWNQPGVVSHHAVGQKPGPRQHHCGQPRSTPHASLQDQGGIIMGNPGPTPRPSLQTQDKAVSEGPGGGR